MTQWSRADPARSPATRVRTRPDPSFRAAFVASRWGRRPPRAVPHSLEYIVGVGSGSQILPPRAWLLAASRRHERRAAPPSGNLQTTRDLPASDGGRARSRGASTQVHSESASVASRARSTAWRSRVRPRGTRVAHAGSASGPPRPPAPPSRRAREAAPLSLSLPSLLLSSALSTLVSSSRRRRATTTRARRASRGPRRASRRRCLRPAPCPAVHRPIRRAPARRAG